MEESVDLLVVHDSVAEAEHLCATFEDSGLLTALALGPVGAAQMLRTHRPRLVLIASTRLSGDDAGAVVRWLRDGTDDVVFGCLIEQDLPKRLSHFRDIGFDFSFRMPLPPAVVHAIAQSAKSVRQHFGRSGERGEQRPRGT